MGIKSVSKYVGIDGINNGLDAISAETTMDIEKELLQLNDDLLADISTLARYLGNWFDKDGKLICEIPHDSFSTISSTIMSYATDIMMGNTYRNYVVTKIEKQRQSVQLKKKERTENHDEADEGI